MINLDILCKEYKIFIDTCSLMFPNSEAFHMNLYNSLYKSNTKLILAKRVYNELLKQALSVDYEKKKLAKNGLKFIERLTNENLLDIREENNEINGGSKDFADAVFPMVFSKNRLKHNLCLITQDKDLSVDMLGIKYSQSVLSSKKIKIFFIDNKKHELNAWEPRLERTDGLTWEYKKNTSVNLASDRNRKIEKFILYKDPQQEKEQLLSVNKLPSSGEYIYSSSSEKIKLVRCIGAGGEGELFETDNGLVCKIYKKERLTNLKERKLKLMLSKHITIKGVCFPKGLVFNSQQQFIGYLMNQAKGYILQTSVFGKPVLQNKFPKWKRENLVQLALTITRTIEELHNRNIIIGDINPSNILVMDENKVFFVDTDSYQIERFPCSVGTPTFTAPELQGINYADILRTKEHEMFAVATLIFMILFPGKTPYSSQGGEDLITNIKNRNFSYIKEEGEVDKKPFGSWRFIWHNLHPLIKKNFKEVFNNGNKVMIEDWSKSLGIYLDGIKNNHSSNELFPSTYNHDNRDENSTIVECTECQKKYKVSIYFFDKHKNNNKWTMKCPSCAEIHKLKKAMGVKQPYIKNNQPNILINTSNNSYASIQNKNKYKPYKKPSPKDKNGMLNFIKRIFY